MRIQSKSNQTDLYNQFLLGLQLENKVPKSATAKLNPKSVFTGLKKPLNDNDNINHESPAKIPDHIVNFRHILTALRKVEKGETICRGISI